MSAFSRRGLIWCAAAFVASCEGEDFAGTGGPAVRITPSVIILSVGDTVRFLATADGRSCNCRWASNNPTVAAVDVAGLVRALAPGLTQVIAIYIPNGAAQSSAIVKVGDP